MPRRIRKTKWAFKKANWPAFAADGDDEVATLPIQDLNVEELSTRLNAAILSASHHWMTRGARADPKPWVEDPELVVCLFIGVLGRVDCEGHFAPITQVMKLMRGVGHGEFDVKDIREKSTCLHPDRIISKETPKCDVCGNVPEVTSTASTVPRTSQHNVRYR